MSELAQERRLVASIPGPKSQLPARKSVATTSVGNSVAAVARRTSAQLTDFTHTCFTVTPYEEYVEVAEALAELAPGDHAMKAALFNSDAEAVENAVKIARAYTNRTAVVVFDHGWTLRAGGLPGPAGLPLLLAEPRELRRGGRGAGNRPDQQAGRRAQVAAIAIEPIQGEGGFIEPAKGFLPKIAQFAKENGIAFVADEIQTGFSARGSGSRARARKSSRT